MKLWDRFDHDWECAALARHFDKLGNIVGSNGRGEINVRRPKVSRAVSARKRGNGDHAPGEPWRITARPANDRCAPLAAPFD